MIQDSDYHTRAMQQMCAVGQLLRAQANLQSVRIRSAAWVREGVTPLDRANMLEQARNASGREFVTAWAAWSEHYTSCLVCQEALKP